MYKKRLTSILSAYWKSSSGQIWSSCCRNQPLYLAPVGISQVRLKVIPSGTFCAEGVSSVEPNIGVVELSDGAPNTSLGSGGVCCFSSVHNYDEKKIFQQMYTYILIYKYQPLRDCCLKEWARIVCSYNKVGQLKIYTKNSSIQQLSY